MPSAPPSAAPRPTGPVGAPQPVSRLVALVTTALGGARRPALVVVDPSVERSVERGLDELTRADLGKGVRVIALGDAVPDASARCVLLVVADLAALRRAASRLGHLRTTREVACVVLRTEAALSPAGQPSWPLPTSVDARLVDGAALTRVEYADRLRVAPVLAAWARAAVPARFAGPEGVRLAVGRDGVVPPVDPTVTATYVAASDHPSDALIGVAPAALAEIDRGPLGRPLSNPVTGHAPRVVDPAAIAPATPLDEGVYNPIGFRRDWDRGVVDLPPGAVLSPALVASLRDAQGVRVPSGADPVLVAGLRMSGVPLLRGDTTDADQTDLADPLRREEESVRRRRAALVEHSVAGWRQRVAGRAEVRFAAYPSVSVVLPTRRPGQLRHALEQVRRQRLTLPGASLELVLATHGFTPDPAELEPLGSSGSDGLPLTVVEAEASEVFGDVLRRATDAASGDLVLKMDDDDWYAPDVVTDLLLARRYSGADVVGMPAEWVYVEPLRVTVRRRGASEVHGAVVAGGTAMIDRALLREIGGWRPARRYVDAHLYDAVGRAGGTTYRTHGLGYVLRRSASGHTWDPGLGYFLTRRAVAAQWRGFRPSALMEV